MDMIATTFDTACSFRGTETAFPGSHGYYERASVFGDLSGAWGNRGRFPSRTNGSLVLGFPNIAVLPDRPPNTALTCEGRLKMTRPRRRSQTPATTRPSSGST